MLDDFREWLSDNLRYILLGLAVLVAILLAVIVFRVVRGGSHKNENTPPKTVKTETEAVTEKQDAPQSTPQTDAQAQAGTEAPSTVSDLVKDDTAVLTLVEQYFYAVAAKDTSALSTVVSPWNTQVEKETLNQGMIESYNNISTYSKKGMEEGDLAVFVYYEAKVPNIDTLAPTLAALYLRQDDTGSLKVYPFKVVSSEVADYITNICKDSDVQALMKDVQASYEAAVASDDKLREYVKSNSSSDGSAEEEVEEEGTSQGEMTSIADLNIRQEPNTNSNIMGVVVSGTNVTVLQDAGDGWVQISYSSGDSVIEGYVKAEYLVSADNAA
ncbi:MAG: SH3 domain-containing protein [Lachnospiraceae bacterium]|nr:SH3 domain-containing protein [Lachnospiraceae bacterium]